MKKTNKNADIQLKFFIYCRKSSEQEDRQVLSLESQENELALIIKNQKLTIVDTYKESGSAHVIGRPLFNQMIKRIENGEANAIFVWDESRIARNSLDGGKVIYMMDLGQILEIRKPGKIYKNVPDDKTWLGFNFTMSKKDSDDKSVNTKRGLKTKAENGWLPSGAKPGYMNDKYAEKGNKTILKDETRFPLIQQAWQLMLSGNYNPPEILRKLNDDWGYRTPKHKKIGGKPMARSMIYDVFTDPFYYGEFEYPEKSGNWIKGKHPTMISEEEFDRVQTLLGRKGSPRAKTKQFTYRGTMICGECGASITPEEKHQIICTVCKKKFASGSNYECLQCKTPITEMKDPTLLHYVYYHCTKRVNPNCTQGSIPLEKLERGIDELLTKIKISDRFRAWAIKHLNEANDSEIDDRNAALESIQKAYKDCVQRIDNLVKLKISPQNTNGELLSDNEFLNQKNTLMKEKAHLEENMSGVGDRITKWIELSEKTFNFACYSQYWFKHGDAQKRREMFTSLGSNMKIQDKFLRVELHEPFEYIALAKGEVPSISLELEPNESIESSMQLEDSWSKNPTLLPDV